MNNIIPDARTTQDAIQAGNAGDTNVGFSKLVADAINTAIGNKATTATLSFSGKAGADVMQALQELRRKGFRVAQASTNWTITW